MNYVRKGHRYRRVPTSAVGRFRIWRADGVLVCQVSGGVRAAREEIDALAQLARIQCGSQAQPDLTAPAKLVVRSR